MAQSLLRMIIAHFVKKLPTIYGTQSLITIFTRRRRTISWASLFQL